jgi:hypothetical protein
MQALGFCACGPKQTRRRNTTATQPTKHCKQKHTQTISNNKNVRTPNELEPEEIMRYLHHTFVVAPGPRRCVGCYASFTDATKTAVGERRFNKFTSNVRKGMGGALGVCMRVRAAVLIVCATDGGAPAHEYFRARPRNQNTTQPIPNPNYITGRAQRINDELARRAAQGRRLGPPAEGGHAELHGQPDPVSDLDSFGQGPEGDNMTKGAADEVLTLCLAFF